MNADDRADLPPHPRDITIGNRPPRPYVEVADTGRLRLRSSYLQVDLPPGHEASGLRVMVSAMSLRGKRYAEVARLHYRSDRQALTRWLAALEPDAARQGIADAERGGAS